MSKNSLKIDKATRPVTLWIHPEGQVRGDIFVTLGSDQSNGEAPEDVLNQVEPFLVLHKQSPDEVRFYNRASIIRAELDEPAAGKTQKTHQYNCKLLMMDGTEISGTIQESLPKEYSRLYDYLNQKSDRFIKLYSEDVVYLINKSYITQIMSADG